MRRGHAREVVAFICDVAREPEGPKPRERGRRDVLMSRDTKSRETIFGRFLMGLVQMGLE